ncbi:MAG TPA: transporter [Planctomycetota bacterium]|nr:transporter [Planctomycetota bacterium]
MRTFPWLCASAVGLLLAIFPQSSWAQTPPLGEPQKRTQADVDRSAEADFLSRISMELGADLEVGRYGGRLPSVFFSIPAELGYDHDGVVASLTVPYDIQRSRGNVLRVGGRLVRVGGKAQRRPKTEGGIGDILLDGGYYVMEAQDELPYLLAEGEVKFPTADDERGLGTGSYDETIRLSSGTTLWKHLKLELDLGYGFIGQPEDIPSKVTDFHDTIYYGGTIGYKFNPSNVLSVKLDGSTRIVPHTPSYDVVLFEYDHYFKNDSRLLISVGPGLTSSSPGLSFEISYLWWF